MRRWSMANYEFWLTDDSGTRLSLLSGSEQKLAFASYSRAVSGYGVLQIGLPYKPFSETLNPYFSPDWRVEAWRSPADGYALRLDAVFLLRKPKVYTRLDGVTIIEFFGRSPIDLLNRRYIIQAAGSTYAKVLTATYADDIMKGIVRNQMLYGSARDKDGSVDNDRAYPQNEFTVQANFSQGPIVTRSFPEQNVLDVLREFSSATIQYQDIDPTQNKIYFDVVPVDIGGRTGFEFRTFSNLRGTDRTQQLEFSLENKNITQPFYSIDHHDEVNVGIARGQGRGRSRPYQEILDTIRINSSRWNRGEAIINTSSETDDSALEDAATALASERKPRETFYATFLNSPGSESTPRSLYGVDWDLGDRIRANYAGRQFLCEIMVVYVAIDENGQENVTGRNLVGELE